MNIFKNIRIIAACLLLFSLIVTSCSKNYLTEVNPSNRTTDNYYLDVAGYESLVTSCYPLLRDIAQQRVLCFQ